MTNLAHVGVNTNGEYQSLATLSSVTFEQGKTYVLQVMHPCRLCESASTPTAGGFYINSSQPIQYTAGSGDLYVQTEVGFKGSCIINIAE